jgi:8-amino-7-oxononanoate synthase
MSGLGWLGDTMRAWEASGLRRHERVLQSASGPRVRLEGRDILMLCSNNYLGLATHKTVVQAAMDAAARWGTGSGASRLVSGTLQLHRQFEQELARFKGTEDAVLFGTGTQANAATLGALVGKGDLIVSDELNHASIIDACRLSRAEVQVYPHGDPAAAERLLRRFQHRRVLLATDGIFSMDGDLAPLPALADACADRDAMLYVDDAHGTLVLGPGGQGTAAELRCADRVDIHMGTLSKAFGAEGGFIAGSQELCDHLRNHARGYIYSTAPAPPSVAAAQAALAVARRQPELRERVQANAMRLRASLARVGLAEDAGAPVPIIPIIIGDVEATMQMADALLQSGILLSGIRPPTVPPGTSRLRATVMATHSADDLDFAARAIAEAARHIPAGAP